MSLNVRGLRASRVRENEAALAQIQTRLQRLQQDEAAANALLAEAHRAADDLQRQRRALQDAERNMAAELEASRAELVQECVFNLPDDILRCIFDEAVGDGAPHTPFAVAAVCVRWRRVALGYSAMWSFIHLFCNPYAAADDCKRVILADHRRAEILLSRSGSAPLHIRIVTPGQRSQGLVTQMQRLYDVVGVHASRWRTAHLCLPTGADAAWLDFLKGPTPLLAQLNVYGDWDRRVTSPSRGGYLPFAPRLQVLDISNLSMGCSSQHGLPALKTLEFDGCTDMQVFDYLRMSSPTLQRLVLFNAITSRPSAIIHLPNLTYLYIRQGMSIGLESQPSMPALCTPRLEHLNLFGVPGDIDSPLLPFLDAVSRTVRRLTLNRPPSTDSLTILARLGNIEELKFNLPFSSFICADALELLASSHPPIWPRLVRIKGLILRTGADGWSADKFLEFVTSRSLTAPRGNDADAALPCKLEEVEFIGGAPHWLVAEVQRLLAL